MRRVFVTAAVVVLGVLAASGFGVGSAHAAGPRLSRPIARVAPIVPALVSLGDASPDLVEAASGWTVEVDLTNLTRSRLGVMAKPTAQTAQGCTLVPTPTTLPASEHVVISFAVSGDCVVKDGLSFKVTVSAARSKQASQTLALQALRPTTTPVDWSQLRVFAIGTPLLVVIGLVIGLFVSKKNDAEADPLVKADGWLGALPYLDSAWSFSDSWLNNLTAGAGLLTGIVGTSDVAKALLGSDADSKLRLATVGAAISVALIAAAPLVLGIFQPKAGALTIVGLFVAAGLSVSAAIGALWVMGQTAKALGVPWLSSHGPWLAAAASLLVLVYAVVSLRGTVVAGLTKPEDPGESDVLKAAALIAAAIHQSGLPDRPLGLHGVPRAAFGVEAADLHEAFAATQQVVSDAGGHTTSRRRRRSALL